MIADVLNHQSKWRPERPPKEAVTGNMLLTLGRQIADDIRRDPATSTSKEHAIFDFLRLGLFTGSRAGEMVQTKQRFPTDFATVPDTLAAGSWAKTPLAFIRADFVFLDKAGAVLEHGPRVRRAHRLRLRFRYDKSGKVGQFRTFQRVPDSFLCPVAAAISILRRADALGVPTALPVGVYARPPSGSFAFLTSDHVTKLLRATVVATYPDPKHLARVHVKHFVTHSIRVTACVALWAAQFSVDEIVFRLRWNSDAVNRYIRECPAAVDALTTGAAKYAFSADT